jgi:hypothetical protein
MDDNALKNYGLLHKANPFIFPLVFQESQDRQHMRNAQQMQGGQEQPKVVDQALAQMAPQQLPEDQGIGRLNAGDMNFAGGGIIAFADGGDVERYAGGGDLLRTTTGGKSWFLDVPSTMRDPSVPYYREIASPFAGLADKQFATKEEALAAYNQLAPTAAVAAPAAATAAPTVPAPSPRDDSFRRQTDPRMLGVSATPPVNTAPAADTTRRPTPGAGLGAAAAAAAATSKDDPFSMSSIKKAQTEALGDSNYKIGELNNQLVDIRNRAETQVQQRLEDRKKEIEAEGDVYKDRSDRLVERGKALAGQKDQNTGLALLNAGLAIMSTPGGLMTAIGKGAQVGTAQYAAGIKDLRAAQERLDEANDRISELRMNRKDLNSREIRALEKDRDAAILDGQKMVFGFAKDIYGMDRKQAEAAFTSYMSGQEKKADIQSRERTAAINEGGANARSAAQIAATLNTPDRILFDQLLKKNDNDAVKALEAFKVAKGDKFDVRSSYADYLKAFAGKEGMTPPMSMGAYAGQFGATLPR